VLLHEQHHREHGEGDQRGGRHHLATAPPPLGGRELVDGDGRGVDVDPPEHQRELEVVWTRLAPSISHSIRPVQY
jgi:hypothetical protein